LAITLKKEKEKRKKNKEQRTRYFTLIEDKLQSAE
jgi:hypothetical protein